MAGDPIAEATQRARVYNDNYSSWSWIIIVVVQRVPSPRAFLGATHFYSDEKITASWTATALKNLNCSRIGREPSPTVSGLEDERDLRQIPSIGFP